MSASVTATPPHRAAIGAPAPWSPPDPRHRGCTGSDGITSAPAHPPARRAPVPPSRRWLGRLAVAAALAGSFALGYGTFVGVAALFALIVPFEKLFPRHRGQRVRRPLAGLDITYALVSPLLNAVGVGVAIVVGVASLAWVPGLLLRPLVGMIPAPVMPFVGLALFDVATYWVHRWMHEVPALWRFHSVHHSSETMDWISGFRNHPVDGTIIAPPFILLIAAGFGAELTGVLAIVQVVTGLFLHANVRWRLRPLHRLVITPEFHHWHHANERDAWHTNYSVFLPVWDIAFGTYRMPEDRRPEVYGVNDDVGQTLPAQLLSPFRGGVSPLWVLGHPRRAVGRALGWVRAVFDGIRWSTTRPTRRLGSRS